MEEDTHGKYSIDLFLSLFILSSFTLDLPKAQSEERYSNEGYRYSRVATAENPAPTPQNITELIFSNRDSLNICLWLK